MSKQELYAWTSLGMSVSILVFYILIFFGWPQGLPDYSSQAVKIFFNVFWVALIGEIILDASESKKRVDKDERDLMIEGRGFRNSYNFLSFAIAIVILNLLITNIFGELSAFHSSLTKTGFIIHILFIVLLLSGIIKRSTQLYYYRRDD